MSKSPRLLYQKNEPFLIKAKRKVNRFKLDFSVLKECVQTKLNIRAFSLVFFAVAYFFRRPSDALYPAVWAEDGLTNIPQALSHQWGSLLMPVNGYLIVPSKFVTLVSMKISGMFYPEVAYCLTFSITIGVLLLLTSKYFTFKGKSYLPIIIALLPYDPEIFSTPLYIIWWTSLLSLIPIFIQASSIKEISQLGSLTRTYLVAILCLALAILSSPLCIFLFPIMAFKTLISRQKLDCILLALWTVLCIYQLRFIILLSAAKTSQPMDYSTIHLAIPKYFGNFFFYRSFLSEDTIWVYLAFLTFVIVGILTTIKVLMRRDMNLLPISISFFMIFAAISAPIIRLGFLPDPIKTGPRYFFLPYIFLSLFLISVAAHTRSFVVKGICILILISACTLTWNNHGFSKFYRIHDPLSWRAELSACLQSPEPYELKVHTDGNLENYSVTEYKYEECEKVVNSGILANVFGLDRSILERF